MSQRIKTLDEIKDSRLLYEKKVPPFGYIIIIIITVFMVLLTVWAYKTPKMSVIKATGTVQSVEKNYVMSPYTGEVVSVEFEEGKVVKKGDVLFTIKSTDLDLQLQQLENQKENLETTIVYYDKYAKSLSTDKNLFDKNDEVEVQFYARFEAYKNKTSQVTIDEAALRKYGYTEEEINEEQKKKDIKIEELYYAELKTNEDRKAEYISQIKTLETQIDAITSGKGEYSVKAPSSGKIHILENYTEGMVIQTGATVASIASDNDELEIMATVSEADSTKIKENDNVDIAISGLTQSVYGTISGKIVSKDTDVTINSSSDGTVSYFRIIVKPDYNYVVSKSGEKVNLSNGMGVEARINYDKVTYFYYVLDALGINLDGEGIL